MEPGSRTTREQRGGMRDDNTSTGGQWDNPMGKGSQGQWEQQQGELFAHITFGWPSTAAHPITCPRLNGQRSPELLLITLSLDNAGGRGGATYTPGQGGYDNTTGGGQTGTGPDIQSDRYTTSGQYGGPERVGQTGYVDPSTRNIAGGGGGRQTEDDDEYGASIGAGGGPTGKPSMTSKVKGKSLPLSAALVN